MTLNKSHSQNTQEQAAEWVVRMHSKSANLRDHQAFMAWLAEDSEHAAAYRSALELWRCIETFKSQSLPELQGARQRLRRARVRRFARITLACAAAWILAVFAPWQSWLLLDRFETAIGEQKTVKLIDGSEITLNTNTSLSIDLNGSARKVNLSRGEAFFKVAHDATRPFEVEVAGLAKISDLGTQFNILRQGEHLHVAVTEGSVALSNNHAQQVLLKPGEQASLNEQGEISPITRHDIALTLQWINGKLSFKKMPLAKVLQNIARYHRVSLRVQDPQLAATTLSGTFDPHNLQHVLTSLETMLPLQVKRLDEQHIDLIKRL